MKIVVLTGSPHKQGTSGLLADRFIEGAKEAGHEIFRFDAAFSNVHPCIGCNKCVCGKKDCVFKDDMSVLYPKLIEADWAVYVTPLYYHGLSAQIKTVIDRFHGIDDLIRGTDKRVLTIVTAANPREWVFEGIKATIRTTARYLGWEDCGGIFACGCGQKADIEKTGYPQKAFELGLNL